jgi:transcriptional regulator with XRE-family HTH domain
MLALRATAEKDEPVTINARFESDDRRTGARRTLHLGVDGVFDQGRTGAATVRDLSLTGLLLETSETLVIGDRFALDLPEAGALDVEVVWSGAPLFGCRFDTPLSSAALSAAQLRAEPSSVDIPSRAEEDFGERIRRLRKERGLSLADIADRLGVSKPTVWAWEHGKSRPVESRLTGLADALGVTPGGLEPGAATPPELIERARRRIADAYGVQVAQVRIMIEL